MDEKHKLKICKKYIVCFALCTRLAVITLQFISNILIIDHNSDGFVSPNEERNLTIFDKTINTFLGGLLHWDGQYFLHIAKYGYTFENTLAFFPLYPKLNAIFSLPISYILPFLSIDSIIIVVFVIINIFFFTQSALALFDLTSTILNRRLAYRATVLFCINPASIFFVAPYTESIFSYFTFTAMLNCSEIYFKNNKTFSNCFNLLSISIPISLSIATRSNGLLNIGFLIYFWLLFFRKSYWPHNIATCFNMFKYSFMLIINMFVCALPFVLIQLYDYQMFCTNFENRIPKFLINYADKNQLVLPGGFTKYNQTWCYKTLPIAYNYIQNHYWNVGFLKYYQFKQIPNFLLAMPIIYLILIKCWKFFKQHKNYCLSLGFDETNIVNTPSKLDNFDVLYDPKMFVFIAHGFFLTIFCIFCVHIQVTTRILCSASPVLYWFCAYLFESINNTNEFDLFSTWKGFLFNNDDASGEQKFVKYYFISYFIVGTILFSNNLPWT